MFPPGFTCPAVLWIRLVLSPFRLQDSHLLRCAFPNTSARVSDTHCRPNSENIATFGLACSAFARHYLRNLGWFLFLALLRCFSSGGSPRMTILFIIRYWCITTSGLPHSEIHGSNGCFRLTVAFRRLLRPSSAPSATAFALRPFSLDLLFASNSSRFENYSF